MGFDIRCCAISATCPTLRRWRRIGSKLCARCTKPDAGQRGIVDYTNAPWNAAHVKSRIDVARDWATAHHVRVICGEFGVLRNHIDVASRYHWIEDARQAMDNDHIGWEVYDYADIFGITSPVGATSTDPVDGSVTLNDPTQRIASV